MTKKFIFLSYILDILSIKYYYIVKGGNPMKNLKLKSARAAKDLSQKELADIVGVSRQTIGMIEAGEYNPTLNLCIAICKALDKTLNDLFWEE